MSLLFLKDLKQVHLCTVCIQEFLLKYNRNKTSTPDTPKFRNGLVQLIKMEESTRQICVREALPQRSQVLAQVSL